MDPHIKMAYNPDANLNSYESAPLPTHQGPKKNLTPEEEEEARISQEIWAEAMKQRQARHEREEKERREREAKLKSRKPRSGSKPRVKPALPDDSEASEKLLQQRKKLEEDRKKFAQMRAARANKEKEDSGVDIVVASPTNGGSSESARRTQTPGPGSSGSQESRKSDYVKPSPIPMEEPVEDNRSQPQRRESSTTSSSSTRSSLTSGSDDNNEWKLRYMQLQSKFEAEQQGKAKLQEVLAQYESTIDSLMSKYIFLFVFILLYDFMLHKIYEF